MCGIAGFLTHDAARSEDAMRASVRAMSDAIAHRGPDDSGTWVNGEAGVALGHRRLSILDLSAAGHQPMASLDGRFVISFNGEIYNFLELRGDLENRGHEFRGHSDTEVLLAGFSEWGVDETLKRSNGMLAIAVWDAHTRTLTLARDRLGKKPLYYGWFGDTLLFGSELKALFRHPRFEWEIDRDALGQFIRYSWLPSPYSILRRVRKLPPASYLSIRAGENAAEATPVAYWSARVAAERGRERVFDGSMDEATDALEDLLRDAVRGRMIADVSLGALLSGGIDSTTVVALMQSMSSRPIKTFCIGFHEPKYNEATHAAAIARHLGTDHTELYVTPDDSLQVIPRLPELYDEPFADPSQIPTFIVSRLARSQVTVALSGDGGDELFAGYTIYPRCLKQWEKWRRMPSGLRRGMAVWLKRAATSSWIDDSTSEGGSLHHGRRRKYAAKLAKRAKLMDWESPVDVLAQKRTNCDRADDFVLGASPLPTVLTDEARWARTDDPLQAMLQVDIEGYLTDDIMVKVDRASMAVALEARCPILDWRVVEFALSLPESMRLGPGGGKLVLRNLLARHVPRALTERPKAGFGVPIATWVRGPLRDWVESLLDEQRMGQDGILSPQRVQRTWRQHLSGSHNHENLLWSILMFQAWHDHWRVNARSAEGDSAAI
jgi:asparagine synthase (glutamine-hydrolysing)